MRLHRLCSDDKDFETKSLEMRTFFVERGYSPTHLLDSAIQKAFSNNTLKPHLVIPLTTKLGTSLAVISIFLKMTLMTLFYDLQ